MANDQRRERKRSASARRTPWLYVAFGVLGGLGAGLLVAAFVLFPGGGGERGPGLGASPGADAPASASAAAPAGDPAAPAGDPAAPAGDAEAQAAGFPARYDTLGVAVGAEDAPVVVREFADYQCPYCARFASVARRVREEYVESGRVRYVFFDLPITGQHPHALVAAEAARCAGRQDAYWEMHDALFERQREWSGADDPLPRFREYARAVGIDPAVLARCVESGQTRPRVERSAQFARALGIGSTPTIVIGNRGFAGARPWAEVRSLIEERLTASN